MEYVADLHFHSKYSRAVSQDMALPIIAKWAKKKGLDILTTADWTHPLWFREIRAQLQEVSEGLFKLKTENKEPKASTSEEEFGGHLGGEKQKEILFILTTEISSIYSQGGRTRRIHNLVFSPSFETCEKINTELIKRGCNLSSDGRPIIGISSRNLLELILSIDQNTMLVPAHCLRPDSLIHTKKGVKKIKNVSVGEEVYTHKNRVRKVTQLFRHNFKGELYSVSPWYFSLGLATTPEHPFLSLKVEKCSVKGGRCLPSVSHKRTCKQKKYKTYKPSWTMAKDLSLDDVLVFPRFRNTSPVSFIPLNDDKYEQRQGNIYSGGTRGRVFSSTIALNENFCRLLGYYLAEGYTNGRDEIAFSFHKKEESYVSDVAFLMENVFGISHDRLYKRKNSKGVEISFYSKLLVSFFTKHFYVAAPYKAITKTLPDWILHLPKKLQSELFRGWWRGDGGYTSSLNLMNSMKIICLRLGIIPSILKDSQESHSNRGKHNYGNRVIHASKDCYVFSHLAFFEDPYKLLLDPAFKACVRKLSRKHGWIDENYVYLPIRKIKKIPYVGEVFNIEVEEDNSYLSEFAAVHNCWTPWFALYGSMSGFDSIEECFGEYSKYIYAVETGLSSDPEMNWRIKELEKRAIISNSDSHSPAKMGREATVFTIQNSKGKNQNYNSKFKINYGDIVGAIKQDPSSKLKIRYTIEFYPEEGKYHYSGHRNCKVVQSPNDTKINGNICSVCKKPLTLGVMHRVEQLAQEKEGVITKIDKYGVKWYGDPKGIHPPFIKLVPLNEVIAEAISSPVTSVKVKALFGEICEKFGSEIKVLTKTSLEEIDNLFGPRIAEGVQRVRKGDIDWDVGYDGEYGKMKIWKEEKEETETKIEFAKKEENQLGLGF